MTLTVEEKLALAANDIDQALVKIFTAMPERLAQKYKLDGPQLLTAIAMAATSTTATMFAARMNATAEQGMQLRQALRMVCLGWLKDVEQINGQQHGDRSEPDNG